MAPVARLCVLVLEAAARRIDAEVRGGGARGVLPLPRYADGGSVHEPAAHTGLDPALCKAERLSQRKARNRDSASGSRERRNAHLRPLQAAVREVERENAGLVAQLELETAQNVLLQHQA
jgi:hypothetical protein